MHTLQLLLKDEIINDEQVIIPEKLSSDLPKIIHDPGYIDAFRNGALGEKAMRRIGFPWSSEVNTGHKSCYKYLRLPQSYIRVPKEYRLANRKEEM